MQSVFAENLKISQVKDSNTKIQIIHSYFADLDLVLIHSCGLYTILLLWWGTRYLITLLSYTQHYYIVVVYSTLILCSNKPNANTMLR